MSNPYDIPQDAWNAASELLYAVDAMPSGGNIAVIARAIIAAEQREREATMDAANIYMTEQYGIGALGNPVDRARVLALSNRGEHHD